MLKKYFEKHKRSLMKDFMIISLLIEQKLEEFSLVEPYHAELVGKVSEQFTITIILDIFKRLTLPTRVRF